MLWQPKNLVPTFCYKDLATGRYTKLGATEDLAATEIIKRHGPKGGESSRLPNAIHIVQYLGEEVIFLLFPQTWYHETLQYFNEAMFVLQKAEPPPSNADGHASYKEWYDDYGDEMKTIEDLHKDKAGIKTKFTVKKRKQPEDSDRSTATVTKQVRSTTLGLGFTVGKNHKENFIAGTAPDKTS